VVDWGEIKIAPEAGGIRMKKATGTLWRIRRTGDPRGERPPEPITIPLHALQNAAALAGAASAAVVGGLLTKRLLRRGSSIRKGGEEMKQQETLIAWLNDAHAMEKSLAPVLENHAKDADLHPEMQVKLQEHLNETKQHAELVAGCIKRLGGSVSTVKSGLGTVMGTVQGMSTGMAKDELVKNALADYAAEHFEIASYRSLIAAAEELGDQQTVGVCQQILRDEEEMAGWLEQHLPTITREYLAKQANKG
jgi:ferritin-like metal-binding protein YciE